MDVKALLAAAIDKPRFLDAYGFVRRKITKSQVAILMYHRVSPKIDPWSLRSLSPQSFETQIKYFSKNYEILSLDRLIEYIVQGEPFPEKAVVMTFDDGYKDNYRYAYPILKRYNIPATIFLTTGHIGTGSLFWWDKVSYCIQQTSLDKINLKGFGSFSLRSEKEKYRAKSALLEGLKKLPGKKKDLLIDELRAISGEEIPDDLGENLILSWDEIKEMSCDGIAFGAHTVNHPIIKNLPFDQAKWEIIQSKKDIEKMIGNPVTAFSYPNGIFSPDIAELVRTSGFKCAVAVSPCGPISLNDSLYGLGRIIIEEDFSKSKVMLSGLWGDLKFIHWSTVKRRIAMSQRSG